MLQRTPGHGSDSAAAPAWWERLLATVPVPVQIAVVVTIAAAVIVAILIAPKATMCACWGALLP